MHVCAVCREVFSLRSWLESCSSCTGTQEEGEQQGLLGSDSGDVSVVGCFSSLGCCSVLQSLLSSWSSGCASSPPPEHHPQPPLPCEQLMFPPSTGTSHPPAGGD